MTHNKHSDWSYDFFSYDFVDNEEKLVIKHRNCEGTYSTRCIITKEMFLAMYDKWIKNEESNSERNDKQCIS